MKVKKIAFVFLIIFTMNFIISCSSVHSTQSKSPIMNQKVAFSKQGIGDYLEKRISAGLGVSMALSISHQGDEFRTFAGKRNTDEKPDHQTLYEIGSHTKVFLGVLLGEMIVRGEISLDEKVKDLIPEGASLPPGSENMTVLHLATHTSGLPKDLDRYDPAIEEQSQISLKDRIRPHIAGVYEYLSQLRLLHIPGEEFLYSNLGTFLLGNILERKAGMKFEKLVKERIFDKLGLKRTFFYSKDLDKDSNLAFPHSSDLQKMDFYVDMLTKALKTEKDFDGNFDILNYFGGIISTVEDMEKWIQANQHPSTETSLGKGMILSHKKYFSSDIKDMGLCWQYTKVLGQEALQHGGDTHGSKSRIGFIPETDTRWVLLSNSNNEVGDIPLHTLDPESHRLVDIEVPSDAIPFDQRVLEGVPGIYLYSNKPYFKLTVKEHRIQIEDVLEKKGVIRDLFQLKDGFLYVTVDSHKMRFQKDESDQIVGLEYIVGEGKSVILPKQ